VPAGTRCRDARLAFGLTSGRLCRSTCERCERAQRLLVIGRVKRQTRDGEASPLMSPRWCGSFSRRAVAYGKSPASLPLTVSRLHAAGSGRQRPSGTSPCESAWGYRLKPQTWGAAHRLIAATADSCWTFVRYKSHSQHDEASQYSQFQRITNLIDGSVVLSWCWHRADEHAARTALDGA
jgi:hypothetical protein